MANLRIVEVTAISSTNLIVRFTESLAPNITVDNIKIVSDNVSVPDAGVLSVTVSKNALDITCQPLTPSNSYKIVFSSTNLVQFTNVNGTSFLFEDGQGNVGYVVGPEDSSNVFLQNLNNLLHNQIYKLEDGSLVSKLVRMFAVYFVKSLYDLRQVKNENYLSKTILDEKKIRGAGAFDRLSEEGAYQILRVGKTKTEFKASTFINYSEFPPYIVSLRQESISDEQLQLRSEDAAGGFNINNFTLTVAKKPVIKLTKLVFYYNSILANGNNYYEYPVTTLGYQVKESKYDPNYGFKYLLLEDNQFRISDKVLEDGVFSLDGITKIAVSYQYKNTGRIINPSSVVVSKKVSVAREVVEPLKNIFNLEGAPVVDAFDKVPTLKGVSFFDPNSYPSLTGTHPAFTNELTYSLEALPSKAGEYSVDYATGTVYVFGQDYKNDGTGAFPPLVSYNYRLVFKPLIDYVYDEDEGDIVALPNGNLINTDIKISFDFQDTLVDGIDYSAKVHEEALSEHVENRYLPTQSAIRVKNTPITNVFRIFNETKGVVYSVERWSNDKVYFRTTNPPSVLTLNGERVSFQVVLNDLLFVNETLTNGSALRVFKILLSNNNIISATEDCVATSFNTSLSLSNGNVFVKEIYFDSYLTESQSINRLTTIGSYTVDYAKGVIYCAVSNTQDFDLGTASYKRSYISPAHSHVLNPVSIYYRRNILQPKDKEFDYVSYEEGGILPTSFDVADERRLVASDAGSVYVVNSGEVGGYVNGDFTSGVANNIKFIRSLFEYTDLLNNLNPVNFADVSMADERSITLSAKEYSSVQVVEESSGEFYVNTNLDLQYLSPNITVSVSVTRLSDSATLWNGTGTYTLGSPVRLHLPGINSTAAGDHVSVVVSLQINNLSRVVVDYNKGDYYVDYTYLADELVVSYEYGENQLDFRQFDTLDEGDTYYVTYRVGALRDALLKNFGTLIDIPILNVFDSTFERERYREALLASLSSFVKGPTISAMKKIVSTITHVDPEIVETVFENWSLGNSFLYPIGIKTEGRPAFLKGKYGMGVLLNNPEQTITFPASSNLRLEEGTFGTWIIPQWNGIDNDADLTFTVKKSGSFASEVDIFIGAGEFHPDYHTDSSFTVSKMDKKSPLGRPNKNKPGVYIYLEKDGYGNGYVDPLDGYTAAETYSDFYRWYVDVVNPDGLTYNIVVKTNGGYFDMKALGTKLHSTSITSGTNQIKFDVVGGAQQGITFVSDINHYVLDAAITGDPQKNRISIFKDVSGYMNLRVLDKDKAAYSISADVSSWKQNEKHHVAASWKLNSKNERDELHLFIDGAEVPNIIRYGDRIPTLYGRKFRTINPEEIASTISSSIVSGLDLVTTSGSSVVTSATNFAAAGIKVGDNLYVEEPGFNTSGYSITAVTSTSLTLASTMPLSLTQAEFTVNKTTLPVATKLEAYPNVAVSVLKAYYTASDGITFGSVLTSASTNFTSVGVEVGDFVRIDGVSVFDTHYLVTSVTSSTVVLNRTVPSETGLYFSFHKPKETELPGPRALFPYYQLSKSGTQAQLVLRNGVSAGDLVLIKSLGMNFKRVRSNYYVWSDSTNTIQTRLPAPLSLDDVSIYKILLPPTNVGPSNTDGYVDSSDGYFEAAFTTDQPILSDTGRTLSVTVAASNVNYNLGPVTIEIYGDAGVETLVFDQNETQNTINKFKTVTIVRAYGTPIDSSKNYFTISIKEKNPITVPESSATYPAIRFSYQVRYSNTLIGNGTTTITDNSGTFSSVDVGNYVHIFSPGPAVGYYKILSVSDDHKSCTVDATVPSFIDGTYEILNVTTYRSGLQNGYFVFEEASIPGQQYYLTKGAYEFDYESYISIKFDPVSGRCFIGSDLYGKGQANAIIDETIIRSTMLTDIRIGETLANAEASITKDYNALKQAQADSSMLVLLHCENGKVQNEADFYVTMDRGYVQAGHSVNDSFKQSLALRDTVMTVPNAGILNTHAEGTIEFWVSPMVDTANDPNYRFYFDAAGIVTEEITSINNSTIQVSGRIGKLLGVKVKYGDRRQNYSSFGTVSTDKQTITLNQQLPRQEMPVIVTYLPTGVAGDRISIYKDPYGQLTLNVTAAGRDYQIRVPIFWAKDTWHRVKATFKFNGGKKKDEIRLFVDGFERGNVLFGEGLLFGENLIFGQAYVGRSNLITTIKFKDMINQFNIGSDYSGNYSAYCLIDNLRISNVSRPGYIAFGEAIDVNYNSNTDVAVPVTEDLYTTYLLDFNKIKYVNTDFTLLKSKNFGQFDFSINISDSFGIVKGSDKVKEVLETLINTLKPGNSRVFITYE